ncbi:MAG: HTTM domain-containing protein [Chitinophagales bacterium]
MNSIKKHITTPIPIAPLVTFRVLFGFIMLISIIRFLAKGWVTQLYVEPTYYFSFIQADWFTPLSSTGMHFLFVLMGLAALGIMLGSFYKLSVFLFFVSFTYVELLDKSNYLNHYYFVSIISFLLLFVPANRAFSLDAIRKPFIKLDKIPAWCINIFKLQLIIVYFYAGAAKLNTDWLIHAMPLKIWLPAHADFPIIGNLLTKEWVAYAFSWSGAAYDLFVPFLLLFSRTRVIAYMAVIAFHLLTRMLFPIGMFPYIMILSTLIFFSPQWHEGILRKLKDLPGFNKALKDLLGFKNLAGLEKTYHPRYKNVLAVGITLFFVLQLILPWRYTLYDGNLFWTEQGYRFSWRVMLMEKAGHATFYIKNPETNKEAQIDIKQYLAPHQEKQMAFQPDMLLQFAHFLDKEYQKQGIIDPEIRVESYVTLNGSKSKLIIDPTIDLSEQSINLKPKKWIMPFADNRE